MAGEGLPTNVEKQGAAADELQKKLMEGTLNTEEEVTAQETPEGGKKEPVKKQENDETHKTENFEAKYKVLQGKYDAEVPRLAQQVEQLSATVESQKILIDGQKERILALEGIIASGKQSGGEEEKGTGETGTPELLNPDDFEDYGSEMYQLIDRVNSILKKSVESKTQQAAEPDDTLKKDVEALKESDTKRLQREFFSEIKKAVDNWEKINEMDEWKVWLGERDPISGLTYQQCLDDSARKFDATRAANVFKKFIKLNPALNTQSNGEDTTAEETGDNELGEQVIPDSSGGKSNDPTGHGGEVKYPTRKEYQVAVRQHLAGKLSEKSLNKITALFQQGIKLGKVT